MIPMVVRRAAMVAMVVANAALAQQAPSAPSQASAPVALGRVVDLDIRQAPARHAFAHIARVGDLNLVADWPRLAEAGVNPDQPLTVVLQQTTVARALRFALMQMTDDATLMIDVQPAYAQLLTKAMANRTTIIKVYLIGDLLVNVPHFDNAPKFDLTQIVSDNHAPATIFTDTNDTREPQLTRTQRGQQIAEVIRRTIEPDIWEANGGTVGRIQYLDGRLIIRAPHYVHRRIGQSETDMFLRRQSGARLMTPGVGVMRPVTGSVRWSQTTTTTGWSVRADGQGVGISGRVGHVERRGSVEMSTSGPGIGTVRHYPR